MQNVNYKEIFAKYGHFIAIAICVVFNVGWFTMSGDPDALTLQDDAETLVSTIENGIKTSKLPKNPIPNFFDVVSGHWNVKVDLQPAPDYTYIYPPATNNPIYEVAPAEQWINKPSQIGIDVKREKIDINWSSPSILRDENNQVRQMTKVEGYELVREWTDIHGKKQKQAFVFDLYKKQYEDLKVEPKISYSYKVRTYSKNKKAKGGEQGKINGEDVVLSPFTNEVKGEIESQFEMYLLGAMGTDAASLELRKWQQGDWRTTICIIPKGKPIQKEDRVKGLEDPVKFNPGWTLLAITTRAPKTFTRKVKKTILVDGKPTVVEEEIEEVREVPAIIYEDEKGIKHKLFIKDK